MPILHQPSKNTCASETNGPNQHWNLLTGRPMVAPSLETSNEAVTSQSSSMKFFQPIQWYPDTTTTATPIAPYASVTPKTVTTSSNAPIDQDPSGENPSSATSSRNARSSTRAHTYKTSFSAQSTVLCARYRLTPPNTHQHTNYYAENKPRLDGDKFSTDASATNGPAYKMNTCISQKSTKAKMTETCGQCQSLA